MIIVKVRGGIGNQLFQMAFARRMRKNRFEVVLHDLADFALSQGQRAYCLDLLGWRVIQIASRRVLRLAIFVRTFGSFLRKQSISERIFGFDSSLTREKSEVLLLDGYFQSWKYVKDELAWMKRTFRRQPLLRDVSRELLEEIQAADSLILHIRRGDYVSNQEAAEFHGVCSVDYYESAISYFQDKLKVKKIFVFSDDKAYSKVAEGWCGGLARTVDLGSSGGDLAEFALMTLGTNFVIANSTFSYWAALLSVSRNPKIVAPKRWFRNQELGWGAFFPPDWILL